MTKHGSWHEFNYYKEIENRVVTLQSRLEYTYNSKQFWLKMFWLQAITTYLISMLN